jgi:hypothetical protein
MELPIVFDKCPVCGEHDTVCQIACKDEPSVPKGSHVSIDKLVTPIQDPNAITLPTCKCIITHWDVCASCGTRYCTKAEVKSLPVTTQHRGGTAIRQIGPQR